MINFLSFQHSHMHVRNKVAFQGEREATSNGNLVKLTQLQNCFPEVPDVENVPRGRKLTWGRKREGGTAQAGARGGIGVVIWQQQSCPENSSVPIATPQSPRDKNVGIRMKTCLVLVFSC